MASRRATRRLALELLYEYEIGGGDLDVLLERHRGDPGAEAASALVRGVWGRIEELDAMISSYSQGWSIDRMPPIDRNLLRLAIFEMIHVPDVPAAVAINEAVELAKKFSTEDSGRFVNGILGRIALTDPGLPPKC